VGLAHRELLAFEQAWRDEALPPSIAAIHVRAAADALGELIGAVRVDDVLDVVFASFCVGK
jgi:tRNA modification GTPase